MDELERMTTAVFKRLTSSQIPEGVAEPKVLTADGEDMCVVMSIDEYARMRPLKVGGQMTRIQGKLFREVE